MARFKTSDGVISVSNWGYQLQGKNGQPLDPHRLSRFDHDMLVIDPSENGTDAGRFSRAEVSAIQDGPDGRRFVAAYISIGEASDFRDYWDRDWTTNGKANGRLTDAAPDLETRH